MSVNLKPIYQISSQNQFGISNIYGYASIQRLSDNAWIPFSNDNSDFRNFIFNLSQSSNFLNQDTSQFIYWGNQDYTYFTGYVFYTDNTLMQGFPVIKSIVYYDNGHSTVLDNFDYSLLVNKIAGSIYGLPLILGDVVSIDNNGITVDFITRPKFVNTQSGSGSSGILIQNDQIVINVFFTTKIAQQGNIVAKFINNYNEVISANIFYISGLNNYSGGPYYGTSQVMFSYVLQKDEILHGGEWKILSLSSDNNNYLYNPDNNLKATILSLKSPIITTVSTKIITGATGSYKELTISGTAEAGSKVTIYDDGGSPIVGNATADATTGMWTFTPGHANLPSIYSMEHTFLFTAKATNLSGFISENSTPVMFDFDSKAPLEPTLVQGTGTYSKVLTITHIETGGVVNILNDQTDVTSKFTAGPDGIYIANAGAFNGSETINITATVTDTAGNTSRASMPVTAKIDTTAPASPYITTTSATISNTKPTIAGIAESGSLVTVYDGGSPIGTATADANTGTWTFTPSIPFSQNNHVITSTATDSAGNVSFSSSPINLMIDTINSKIISAFGPRIEISSTKYHPRFGATSWNGNQFITTEGPTNSYQAGSANQFNVELNFQNNIGDLYVNSARSYQLATAWSSWKGTNVVPFTFTQNSDGSIKSGAFWIDLGSASSTTYSVKYESFNINLPSATSSNFSLSNQSQVSTLLSNVSLGNSLGWSNNSTSFAVQWETPVINGNKSEIFAFFDTSGNQIGSTVTVPLSSTSYADFGGTDTDGNYELFTYTGSTGSLRLYNPTGVITTNYSQSGSFAVNIDSASITADNWNFANKSNGSFLNYEIAIAGTRNNQGVVDFYQLDVKTLSVTKTQSLTLSGATSSSRIQTVRLSDNSTTVFGYQDGTTLHLTEIGSDGSIITDYTQTLATGAIFDRIRSLSNGLFEIIYRQPGSVTNSMNYEVQLFDTRSAAVNINSTTTTSPTNYAGTSYNDSITVSAPNSMVMGSEGNDILTANLSATNSILSYEYLNEGINANLSTGVVTANNVQGALVKTDSISGFETIVGTLYNDNIVGDANNNTFYVLGGNDTIDGDGGTDTAIFGNDRTDYLIIKTGSNTWTVQDRSLTPDIGTATLTNVENLQFGDGTTLDLTIPLVNNPVTGYLNIVPNGTSFVGTGQVLSADISNLWDADGIGSITYQWMRNGSNITGATASTYTVVSADLGQNISLQLNYIDGLNQANSVLSNVINPVTPINLSTFHKIDPAGTYLGSSTDTLKKAPTTLTLAQLGVSVGDYINLQQVGNFQYGSGISPSTGNRFTDTGTNLLAVFLDANGNYISAKNSINYVSQTQSNNSITDISQDFLIDSKGINVLIPQGAVSIAFSVDDVWYSDNIDTNNNFGVNITKSNQTITQFGPRQEFTTGTYHPRMGAAGWNGYQFFLTESPTTNYVKGNINQANVEIQIQNNVGDIIVSNNSLNLGTAWTSLTGTNGKPFTFTTNQDGSIKAGAFWFDKGSATGTSYSVKYESFNINLPNVTSLGFPYINNQSAPQTLLTGLSLNNYGWANSSNTFAIYWETPVFTTSVPNTKTENIAFFDTAGSPLGNLVSLTIASTTYATFGGSDSDGNYVLFTYSGTNGSLQLYNPSTLVTSNYIASGNFTVGINSATLTADDWNYTNKNTNGSFANYEIALSGVRNNQGVVDFYQVDAKTLSVNKTQTVILSGSLGASRIQDVRLSDNATVVFAYQDGSILHLTEIGADGSLISDYTQILAAGAIFDRIRSLSNGLFEIVYRQPGSIANSMNYEIQIFDTRSGPLSINNTSTTSLTNYAGTAFNDSISISAPNTMIMGSEGNDTLIATASATNAVLSYEYLNEGINANLTSGIVTATNTQGVLVKTDTISGFKTIVGTIYNDNITGDANNNMFYVLGGNDTINGNGGMDYAEFSNNRADYLMVQNGNTWTVTDRGSSPYSGTTTLTNVRFLEFGWDGTVIDLSTTPVNHAMTGSVTITGQATVGQTMTASNNLTDADGTGTISYQWMRNGTAISGATSSTYQASQADLGANLSVSASYTDGWNIYNSANSNAVTIGASSTSIGGQIYFWNKSASGHALINGASVSVVGSGATAQSQLLLSNVAIDSSGNVTADLTANLSAAADNFSLYLSLGGNASNVAFTSSLSSANFNVISSALTGGGLNIAGYGNISGTSTQLISSGQTKIGSISFNVGALSQLQISVLSGTNFNNSNTGQQYDVTPYAYVSSTTKTDANGSYSMQIASGNYIIGTTNPSANIGNAVTAADALAALKIAVGLNPNSSLSASAYQILAADYNHDGKVTAADALSILKAAVQYPGSTAPSWQFVSETADLSQISRTNSTYTPPITAVAGNFIQNMVGMIAGDVNGSWTPPSGSSYIETTNANYFTQLSQKLSVPTSQWGV